MHFDETFWVALSFIAFIALFIRFAGKPILSIIDSRGKRIENELSEALSLKEEAQALLASYQQKQKDAEKEAKAIISNAEEEAKRITKQSESELETLLNRRIEAAMQKISNQETAVLNEIRSNAVDIVIGAVNVLVQKHMSEEVAERLVEQAIIDTDRKLN